MGGEWVVRAIGDIAEVIGGSTPSTRDPANFDGDIPWLTPKDLAGPHPRYVSRGERNLSRQGLESCSAQLLPANSVLLSSRAPIGYLAIAANPIATNQGFRSLVVKPDYNHEYVYYWLSANTDELERHATGSTFKELSGSALKQIRIRLPADVAEQRAIAHILGTLDDKIELNRRMSETLEAMARALFQSWFVDFDPVRAKMEGRWRRGDVGARCNVPLPGLPAHLYDLFPARLVPSELGEIPEGWEVGPLGRFFEVGLGGAWGDDAATTRASIAVRCLRGIDCHDLAEGRIPEVPVRWVSPKQAADRQLSDGTILIEGSGSFCGRSMIWKRAYGALIGEPVSYSNFCKRLNPVCSVSQAAICWMQLRQAYRDGLLQSFRTGTAFPNFDVHGALASFIVIVPPDSIADEFARMFGLSQRLDLMAQSRTLAALRDALLPKLISGELRVKDAERFLKGRGL